MRKVAVFVDGSNLYRAFKERDLIPVDITALAWRLAGGRPASMRFYTAPFPGHGGFVKALEARGWLVVMGRTQGGSWGHREKGVDVNLAVDLVLAAAGELYHRAVLVSGDGDLVRAVEAARELGLPVTVAQFQEYISGRLAGVAEEVVLLDGVNWKELGYAGAGPACAASSTGRAADF